MPGVEQTLQEDLFTATEGSYLLHACNCMGTWGSGIACARLLTRSKEFTSMLADSPSSLISRTPSSNIASTAIVRTRRSWCVRFSLERLVLRTYKLGTSYIIETRDYEIVCCFTSLHYGQRRDSEEKILASTKRAAEDLVRQLKERQEESPSLAACKLNAGKFGVRSLSSCYGWRPQTDA